MQHAIRRSTKSIHLLSIADLRPHEEHDPEHAAHLAMKISCTGLWTTPIIVEQSLKTILDGHHRFAAARGLGLRLIPSFLVDYRDPEISTSSWRNEIVISRKDVMRAGGTGRLLPKKTSRHQFPYDLPICAVSTSQLNERGAA